MSNIISQSITTIKNWWLFLLSGILLITGAIYVFYSPEESYLSLSWIFSILVFANGLLNIIFSVSNRKQLDGWGWHLVGGIFEIIVGVILIYYPTITIVMLPVFVGFWLLFRGINIIGTSLDLKKLQILDWGWFLFLGTLLISIASTMILLPIIGYLSVLVLTSVALFIFGVANILLAFKLKKLKSLTIDKITDIKKGLKSEYNNLKNEIVKSYSELSKDKQDKIDKAFEIFEKKS